VTLPLLEVKAHERKRKREIATQERNRNAREKGQEAAEGAYRSKAVDRDAALQVGRVEGLAPPRGTRGQGVCVCINARACVCMCVCARACACVRV
jgi:hypothetical protein